MPYFPETDRAANTFLRQLGSWAAALAFGYMRFGRTLALMYVVMRSDNSPLAVMTVGLARSFWTAYTQTRGFNISNTTAAV